MGDEELRSAVRSQIELRNVQGGQAVGRNRTELGARLENVPRAAQGVLAVRRISWMASTRLPSAYHWDAYQPPPRLGLRLSNRRPIRVPDAPAEIDTGS